MLQQLNEAMEKLVHITKEDGGYAIGVIFGVDDRFVTLITYESKYEITWEVYPIDRIKQLLILQ